MVRCWGGGWEFAAAAMDRKMRTQGLGDNGRDAHLRASSRRFENRWRVPLDPPDPPPARDR